MRSKLKQELNITGGGARRQSLLLVSSWRSGSTFAGEVLQSHPAVFLHYEPLLYPAYRVQVRPGDRQVPSLQGYMRNLLRCQYPTGHVFIPPRGHKVYFKNNQRLWPHCSEERGDKNLCSDGRFVTDLCGVYQFQAMKLVRLRASLTGPLLEDPDLDARVVVLVRDPRGTMSSRRAWTWCIRNKDDCYHADVLCRDLAADYRSVEELGRRFPGRVTAVRYEDLAANPAAGARNLLDFSGIPMHPSVLQYMESHTKVANHSELRAYSTYRDSQKAPFLWRDRMSFKVVRSVQNDCQEAMELWGYRRCNSMTDCKRSNPVLPLKLNLTKMKK